MIELTVTVKTDNNFDETVFTKTLTNGNSNPRFDGSNAATLGAEALGHVVLQLNRLVDSPLIADPADAVTWVQQSELVDMAAEQGGNSELTEAGKKTQGEAQVRTLILALLVVPTLALTGACTNVKGTVVGNAEDAAACPSLPKTFALSVETTEKHTDSAGNVVNTIRTVCVDAGLASSYQVVSNYP